MFGKLHNEDFGDLYSPPSIIKMNKSRRMRWAGNVVRLGRRELHIGYWWESHKEKRRLERSRRRLMDNIKMYLRDNSMI
jgi:hypothetical protein